MGRAALDRRSRAGADRGRHEPRAPRRGDRPARRRLHPARGARPARAGWEMISLVRQTCQGRASRPALQNKTNYLSGGGVTRRAASIALVRVARSIAPVPVAVAAVIARARVIGIGFSIAVVAGLSVIGTVRAAGD